jgi:hypothetical protein
VAGASEDDKVKVKALGKSKDTKADRKETLDRSDGELVVVKLKGKSVQDAINDIGADDKAVSDLAHSNAHVLMLTRQVYLKQLLVSEISDWYVVPLMCRSLRHTTSLEGPL